MPRNKIIAADEAGSDPEGSAGFPPAEPPDHRARLADPDRLAALDRTALTDVPAEEPFDRLTRLARMVTGAPIALISMVDDRRQVFISQQGLRAAPRETPLASSFCQYVVSANRPLQVSDAREHPLLSHNEAVRSLQVTAYLGVPIHGVGGEPLGSLCVLDPEPREWGADDSRVLTDLSRMVSTEVHLRRALDDRQLILEEMHHRVRNIFSLVSGLIRLERSEHADGESLAANLGARVTALARAHSLITPMANLSAGGDAPLALAALIATVVAPYVDEDDANVVIDGPEIGLGGRATTNLALVFFELAANAAKYGGFADPSGAVQIRWSAGREALTIEWEERFDRAAVPESPPSGFGSKLLTACIEGHLRGRLETEAGDTRFARRIVVPLPALTD